MEIVDENSLDLADANEVNLFRLQSLILEIGTEVIRESILKSLMPRTLQEVLDKDNVKNQFLNLRKQKILSYKQWNILYRPEGVSMQEIDITLWVFLMRNIALNKHIIKEIHWNEVPRPSQIEWYHDVLRIKKARNKTSHLSKSELDIETFRSMWNIVTSAIRRLDPRKESFESYANKAINVEKRNLLKLIIREQTLTEINSNLLASSKDRGKTKIMFIVCFVVVIILVIVAILIPIIIIQSEASCEIYQYSKEVGVEGAIVFMPRRGWNADQPQGSMSRIHEPIKYALYSHTGISQQCIVPQECCQKVKDAQYSQMNSERLHLSDIAYHFLIDSAGVIYEGRSLKYSPAVAPEWNNRSLSIAMIGNYMSDGPSTISDTMLGSFSLLLNYLMSNKILTSSYTLYAVCEVHDTYSPGKYLYAAVNNMSYPSVRNHLKRRPDGWCTFERTLPREEL